MFLLTQPTPADVENFLEDRRSDVFSYDAVGATCEPSPPPGYDIDHNRQLLGLGKDVFEKAKQAVRDWKMFDIAGIRLLPKNTPVEPGLNVAIVAEHLGFRSLNSCRIVYVIDEPDRFGFAYGTLTEHAESGEERFSVEYHPDTDKVWYDIYAFSRPGNLLISLGYPYARYRQKQFAVGSKAAMIDAVNS